VGDKGYFYEFLPEAQNNTSLSLESPSPGQLSAGGTNFLWDTFPEGYYEKFSEHKLQQVH